MNMVFIEASLERRRLFRPVRCSWVPAFAGLTAEKGKGRIADTACVRDICMCKFRLYNLWY